MKYTANVLRIIMKIGSHVSNNGELMLAGSLAEALGYGANALMVYLGPPQSTFRKPFSALNSDLLKEGLEKYNLNIEDVIIHAPYIVNLAQPDDEKRQFAVDFITNEMKVMAQIGAKYMVIHPGAHMKQGVEKGLELIADSFRKILQNTSNDDTFIAIETMAGKGSECCFEFAQIGKLIELVGKDFENRLVVCFDTCHTHDSGYDIVNDYEGVLNDFDQKVGLHKIKVIHLNDSKNIRGAKKDRHENFGFGYIGFDALMQFINDERFKDVPKILETPYVKVDEKTSYPPYKYEIKMIKEGQFDQSLISKIMINHGN